MSEIDKQVPKTLERESVGRALDVDMQKRTVRNTVCTKLIARDGGIVVPEGIITKHFEQNPVVKIRHGYADDARPLVAGRALELNMTDIGLNAVTQFADNELGREWGYMYGLNPEGEVYMRAFSFGWASLQTVYWSLDQARAYLGAAYDATTLPDWLKDMGRVWVSQKSEMHEYSVVEVGADREALTRCWAEHGIREAGNILTRLNIEESRRIIEKLTREDESKTSRIAKLEKDVLALCRNGSAATALSNTAEVLQQLRDIIEDQQLRMATESILNMRGLL